MQSKTFVVPNISCNHCTHTIQSELSEMAGVASVQADVATKQVTVTWDSPATWDSIAALLQEINFPPANQVVLE